MSDARSPSLLIVTNTHRARWFVVAKTGLKQIAEATQPKEHYSDHEGQSRTRGGTGAARIGGPDLKNKEWAHEEDAHIHTVLKKTAKLWSNSYAYCAVIAPSPMKNMLLNKLRSVPSPRLKFIAGNHVSDTDDRLFALFHESLKAFQE